MCPTSNHMYLPVNGRLIKSNESRRYDQQIDLLKLKLFRQLDAFKALHGSKTLLKVDVITVFPKKKFFTQKNELRKFDSSNRLKTIFDSISKLIGIDDSYFIDGSIIKTFHEKDFETVFVKITPLESVKPLEQIAL